jgi:hypothetical protein
MLGTVIHLTSLPLHGVVSTVCGGVDFFLPPRERIINRRLPQPRGVEDERKLSGYGKRRIGLSRGQVGTACGLWGFWKMHCPLRRTYPLITEATFESYRVAIRGNGCGRPTMLVEPYVQSHLPAAEGGVG